MGPILGPFDNWVWIRVLLSKTYLGPLLDPFTATSLSLSLSLQGLFHEFQIGSPWFIPFTYVIIAKYTYSLGESLWSGETLEAWWNHQRLWLFKRTSTYFFSTIDAALKLLGIAKSAFVITAKGSEDDVSKRYKQEMMEFGSTSPMFTIIATLAMVNLLCLVGSIKRVAMDVEVGLVGALILQFLLCGLLVMINIPVYQGLFLRKDKGRMPPSLAFTSTALAVLACVMPMY